MRETTRRLCGVRLIAVVLIAALFGSGCAAKWAYRQGSDAAAAGDWDLAVARYTRAVDKDPKNIGYKIALETARVNASEGAVARHGGIPPFKETREYVKRVLERYERATR